MLNIVVAHALMAKRQGFSKDPRFRGFAKIEDMIDPIVTALLYERATHGAFEANDPIKL